MTARCSTHARARAGWRCQSCEKTLCPECAAERPTQSSKVTLCVLCGGFAQPIMRPLQIAPFWAMFPVFAKAIFSTQGLIQILAIAIIQWMCSFAGTFGALISFFIYVSYYFRVIASAAQGAEKLPDPDDFLGLYSVFAPVARFILAASVILAPAVIYVLYDLGFWGFIEDPTRVVRSPIVILSAIVAVVYFPAAIIAAAIAESALAVINPMITVRMILRIPGQYAVATALWAALTVVDSIVVNGLNVAAQVAYVPMLTPIALNMVALVIPIFTGFILGRLIYQNHEHFGVVPKARTEEPEWPEAVPAGQLGEAPARGAYGGGVEERDPEAWAPSGLEVETKRAPEPIELGPADEGMQEVLMRDSDQSGKPKGAPKDRRVEPTRDVLEDSGEESGLELDLDAKAPPPAPSDVPYLFASGVDPRSIELDLTSDPLPEPSAQVVVERSAPLELDLENAFEPKVSRGPAESGLELDLDGPAVEAKLDLAPRMEARARTTREIELDLGGAVELDDGEVKLSSIGPRRTAKTDDLALDPPKARDPAKAIPKVITGAKLETPKAIPKAPTNPSAPILEVSRDARGPIPKAPTNPGAPIPKVPTNPNAAVSRTASQPKAMPKMLQAQPEAAPPPPPPPRDPTADLRSALERGDEAKAYELFFEAIGLGSYPDLDPRANLRLAGILEKVAAFDEAVRACQRAAKTDMKGPFAAKAIFTAARIMGERAGNRDGARAMYEFLVKSFPADDLAVRAKEALKRL